MQIINDRKSWLQGARACCSSPPESRKQPYRLVLLGAPGVGKGTQAEMLCAQLGACHLSTGDIFRSAKAIKACEQTKALTEALLFMRRGELVPDQTVLDLVAERVGCLQCEGGFLLDVVCREPLSRGTDKVHTGSVGITVWLR